MYSTSNRKRCIGILLSSLAWLIWLSWLNAGQKADALSMSEPLAPSPTDLNRQIISMAIQSFNPSLEKKENVDFLLTPALLVQEAISEDILTTYPTE